MAIRQIVVACFLLFPSLCLAEVSFEQLYTIHLQKLSYIEEKQPAKAILFSATPGMGKSEISRALSPHYHAVLISSDEMRKTLKEHGIYRDDRPTSENEVIYRQFAAYFIDRLFHEYPNHFYLFDSSVDRKYPLLKAALDAYGLETVLVRLEVPREIVEQRLIEREEHPEYFLRNLDKWFADYEAFDLSAVDIFFDNSGLLDIPLLIEQIDQLHFNRVLWKMITDERDAINDTSRPYDLETGIPSCHRPDQLSLSW